MSALSWLNWIKAKPLSSSSWADQQRNHALELIASTAGSGAWSDLSQHPNGFVREVAVRELSNSPSPEALLALIERLNDWVPQVRHLAEIGMQAYLKREHVSSLLFALGPLMALAVRRRGDHEVTLAKVQALLQMPDVRSEVHASFLAQQSKAACYLFALLLDASDSPEPLLREALSHRELNVRLAAVDACEALATTPAHALLLDALPRSIARVRTRIMRALLPVLEDPKPLLQQALLNGSAAVRNLALWAAPRYGVDASGVLAEQLTQQIPNRKADWLGVLGLARDLSVKLPEAWLRAALASGYPSVRISAMCLPGEWRSCDLLDALNDTSDKVFNVLIARLGDLPWAAISVGVGARLDDQWHELSDIRRQKLLQLLAVWQQVAYLLKSLGNEPARQTYWLSEITHWCDRQYQIIDPFTSKAEQAALKEQLQCLVALGLLNHSSVARVF
ncbi:HEAT repeat domain-containing protein [Pseudomonas sichuanensis]|uniref:HEAT repeat domain-containing protein n=1 Tax=Pseudomonas sichuanensis TaxID=2213015 RepID=UPI000DA6C36B|nr:PBS lyase [Pseudomonas sichuanensis]